MSSTSSSSLPGGGDEPAASSSSSSSTAGTKRKRTTKACDVCNRRKVKCDGIQPACTQCLSSRLTCTYQREAKKRGPKQGHLKELELRLRQMEALIRPLSEMAAAATATTGSPAGAAAALIPNLASVQANVAALLPTSPSPGSAAPTESLAAALNIQPHATPATSAPSPLSSAHHLSTLAPGASPTISIVSTSPKSPAGQHRSPLHPHHSPNPHSLQPSANTRRASMEVDTWSTAVSTAGSTVGNASPQSNISTPTLPANNWTIDSNRSPTSTVEPAHTSPTTGISDEDDVWALIDKDFAETGSDQGLSSLDISHPFGLEFESLFPNLANFGNFSGVGTDLETIGAVATFSSSLSGASGGVGVVGLPTMGRTSSASSGSSNQGLNASEDASLLEQQQKQQRRSKVPKQLRVPYGEIPLAPTPATVAASAASSLSSSFSSSSSAGSDLFSSSAPSALGIVTTTTSLTKGSAIVTDTMTSTMPDNAGEIASAAAQADVHKELVSLFFTYVNPFLAFIVHERKFRENEGHNSPMLLNAIYAIAARYSKHPAIFKHGGEKLWKAGDGFYAKARLLVSEVIDVPCIDTVIVLVLLVTYAAGSGRGSASWMYSGMAIRMAQSLRLDVDPDFEEVQNMCAGHLTPFDKELRRRVWWVVFVMDRYTAATADRAMLVNEHDCSVANPMPAHRWLGMDPSGKEEDTTMGAGGAVESEDSNMKDGGSEGRGKDQVRSPTPSSTSSASSSSAPAPMSSLSSSMTSATFGQVPFSNSPLDHYIALSRIFGRVIDYASTVKTVPTVFGHSGSHRSSGSTGSDTHSGNSIADRRGSIHSKPSAPQSSSSSSSSSSSASTTTPDSVDQQIAAIESALRSWLQNLPDWIRVPGRTYTPSWACTTRHGALSPPPWEVAYLHVLYSTCVVLLHRPKMMQALQTVPVGQALKTSHFCASQQAATAAATLLEIIMSDNLDFLHFTPF
ncbi:hypothetical protein HK102_013698, partial [Quaeritorhiza haematococci]